MYKKLKEFSHEASIITSLLRGGKISSKDAYKKIKQAWKEVKNEHKEEKKNNPPPSDHTELGIGV